MNNSFSRRQIIRTGLLAAIGGSIINKPAAANLTNSHENLINSDYWNGFKLGVASYTFRKLNLDDTIKAMQRLNLKYISIKDFHLALTSTTAERQAAMQKLKAAGITALSCGNITMQNDEKDIRRAFDYAKDCGMPTIVCSPHP